VNLILVKNPSVVLFSILQTLKASTLLRQSQISAGSYDFADLGGVEILATKNYGVIVIGEYIREFWGEGGADTNWCCSSNGEARNDAEPVHASDKIELTKLTNKSADEQLVKSCQVRIQEQQSRN